MDDADVVVVGAGSAGCVLARRLAEPGDRRVILVEAGDQVEPTERMVDGWHVGQVPDWGYVNAADEAALRRGRLVGGSSWFTRFAVRGHRADFDRWARLGIDGWGYDEVLTWFRRVEADLEHGTEPWHGSDGPIPVTRYPALTRTPAHVAAIEALEARGFAAVDDVNRPDAVGVGPMPMNSRDGRRVTTFDAFLDGKDLPGLERRTGVVDRVQVQAGRATGVRLADGSLIRASTVVLAAGTYGSPTILLRSGIGPAIELRALGVPVVADLPGVGRNLADHPAVDLDTGYAGPGVEEPALHSIATFRSAGTHPSEPPDLMFWVTDPEPPEPHFYLDPILLKPEARGTLRLRSPDASVPPVIDLPVPDRPRDVARLSEGYDLALEVMATRPLRTFLPTQLRTRPSQAELLAGAYSLPHVVGTCRMGPAAADGAVVDDRCRVHAIDGLWIADASVLPEPPAGFPQLIVIALAERVASWI
jgi:choline dehydrogenase